MSHVFISYAHADQDKYQILDKFIAELKKAGFTDDDIWYDNSIEAGTRWRIEIDTTLEESFAVVVLLGPAAMKSEYVTYEWSWAVGNGIPLFPLVLEGSYDDIHPRLLDLHCVDCRKGIPGSVIEAIKNQKETPRDTEYLSRLIVEMLLPFRIRARVMVWLYPYYEKGVIKSPAYRQLIDSMLDEARELHSKKLPQFRLSYSHAFASKQTRKCRDLMRNLLSFWLQFNVPVGGSYYVLNKIEDVIEDAAQIWLGGLEPNMSFFETSSHYDAAYIVFDNILREISKEPLKTTDFYVFPTSADMVLGWFLPDAEQELIRQAIRDVKEFEAKP